MINMLQLWLLGVIVGCAWAGIPGGKTPVDVNNPEVQVMAGFAVTTLNGLDSRKELSDVGLTKVLKAERQVVAGINYYMDIEVKEAGCSSNCRTEVCKVTIFDQEWTNTRDLTHFACQPIHQKRGNPIGGVYPVSVDTVEVKNATRFAVSALNRQSNALFASDLIRIKSATSQGADLTTFPLKKPPEVQRVWFGGFHDDVVAGLKYTFEIEIGQTSCKNTPTVQLANCAVNTNGKTQTCTLQVLWQGWTSPEYTLLDGFKCQ